MGVASSDEMESRHMLSVCLMFVTATQDKVTASWVAYYEYSSEREASLLWGKIMTESENVIQWIFIIYDSLYFFKKYVIRIP